MYLARKWNKVDIVLTPYFYLFTFLQEPDSIIFIKT